MIVRNQQFVERGRSNKATLKRNVLLGGRVGQGVTIAADILTEAAQLAGFNAQMSEIYGIGRGPTNVRCQVRFARGVIPESWQPGAADYLFALEGETGLQLLPELKAEGHAFFLAEENESQGLAAFDARVSRVDGRHLFARSGVAKSMHLYLLGVLSQQLPIDAASWSDAIQLHLPGKQLLDGLAFFQTGAELPLRSDTAGMYPTLAK